LGIEEVRKITEIEKEKLIIEEEERIDRYIEQASKKGCNIIGIPGLLYDENIAKYRKAGYKVKIDYDGFCSSTIIRW
jgi:hypothetical protein